MDRDTLASATTLELLAELTRRLARVPHLDDRLTPIEIHRAVALQVAASVAAERWPRWLLDETGVACE